MSFSDDGWGLDEKEVNVADDRAKTKPVDSRINAEAIQEVTITEIRMNMNDERKHAIGSPVVVEPAEVIIDIPLPKASAPKVFESAPTNNVRALPVQQEPVKTTNNISDNQSDDGWGDSPMKKETARVPVVSKEAASRLPPSRIQITQNTAPPPVDDTFDIDSPRELSPVPPPEKNILPPQVKSTTSSRKEADFVKPASAKSFGLQKTTLPEKKDAISQVPFIKTSLGDFESLPKSFGTQKTDPGSMKNFEAATVRLKSSDFEESATVTRVFGGSFGPPKISAGFGANTPKIPNELSVHSTGFGSNTSKVMSEPSIKPSGFGGSFGGSKPTGFGGSKVDEPNQVPAIVGNVPVQKQSSFGSAENGNDLSGYVKNEQTKQFGSSTTNKPTSFGGEEVKSFNNFGRSETDKSTGFGGNFGRNTATGFGDAPTTDKRSGFGGVPSTKQPTAGTFNSNRSAGFGGPGAVPEATTRDSTVKPTSFGTSDSTFGGPVSSQKSSGFGGATDSSTTPFGAKETMSFGSKTSTSTTFGGMKTESKSSGFGEGASAGFGSSSGFGSSKKDFGNTESSGFGGSGQFGKVDAGFGESDKSNFGGFGGGHGNGENQSNGCRNCGEEGHFARDCEKPREPRPCRNCNEIGHFSKDCDKPKVPYGPCRNCGEEGHFSRDCDKPKVPYGPCRNCGEEGHFAKECTKERVRQEPTEPCRRCNEEGHWAYECPTRPRDLQGNILVPYDVVFTPETDMFMEAVNNDHRIDFDQKVVASMGDVDIPDMASFDGFKVLPLDVHENLKRMKMTRPTPIQRAAFFPILHGHDVVACAHTGSGKTLAFLIPLMINLLEDRSNHHKETDEKPSPRLLVVAPTRELANQTFNTARQLAYETGLNCGLAYGGYSRSANLQHLRGFDQLGILVATMGRLQDFVESGDVSLAKMKFIVLDEADRMVDFSDFGEDVIKILGPPEKRNQQTILFSASFSENLQSEDLPKIVKEGYTMLQVDKFGTANEKIDQHFLPVPRSEKRTELYKLLGFDENTMSVLPDARIEKEKTLIFVNSVKFCDTLASNISNCGVSCIPMHSHQNQEQRDRTLDDFRHGKYRCMVASNVCARGLNIAGLDHVINYDMPDRNGFDEYVNRIGRTARAGFTGVSTAFIDEEADREIIPSLVKVLTEAKKEIPDWLNNISAQAEEVNEEENEEW